ncbi:hypothetical protein L204_104864 [Cryptococcus depauperatus]
MSMIERLLSIKSIKDNPLQPPAEKLFSPHDSPYRPARKPLPYEIPDKNGAQWLLKLPEELLERVFTQVDRVTFVRCHRVCKKINNFLSNNSSMKLHNLLQTSSLLLNPNILKPNPNHPLVNPPSKSRLLDTLRERLTRFRNCTPKVEGTVSFEEQEGRLYEYLEGVLVRSLSTPDRRTGREVAVYDFRKFGEWEDVASGEDRQNDDCEEDEVMDVTGTDEFGSIRRSHQFNFEMLDFAFDPGQDLFIVAEYRYPSNLASDPNQGPAIFFHILALSTFEPHPQATEHLLKWPGRLSASSSRPPSLGFQICDDGFYVLANHRPGTRDLLAGWQWTTGRLAITLPAPPTSTFESFILISPSSIAIPSVSTSLSSESNIQDDITDPRDLVFSHHLNLYAFPPLSNIFKEGNKPFTATHVATIDLPKFVVDFEEEIPPARMGIRADPPPRYSFPTHPMGAPQAFMPHPESGVIVIEFYCNPLQREDEAVSLHYVMFMRRKTLLAYLPAPTSPLLFQSFSRPAPVVPFKDIAPKTRMLGPNMYAQSWVCYVYQDRYVTKSEENFMTGDSSILLFDFDPLRCRQVQMDPSLADMRQTSGMRVYTEETRLQKYTKENVSILLDEVVTGKELPYLVTELPLYYGEQELHTILIDGERIIGFEDSEEQEGQSDINDDVRLRVMEF